MVSPVRLIIGDTVDYACTDSFWKKCICYIFPLKTLSIPLKVLSWSDTCPIFYCHCSKYVLNRFLRCLSSTPASFLFTFRVSIHSGQAVKRKSAEHTIRRTVETGHSGHAGFGEKLAHKERTVWADVTDGLVVLLPRIEPFSPPTVAEYF